MRSGAVRSSALGSDWRASTHLPEVTTLACPAADGGDTHHLVPNHAREAVMRCRTCGLTEKELREAVRANR